MENHNKPQYWLNVFRNELYNEIIPWWLQHSIDTEEGGYFNCIHEDGSLYDTTKYVWPQGRQVWMFAKLYGDPSVTNDLIKGHGNAVTKDDLLKHSISSANFLIKNSIRGGWSCLVFSSKRRTTNANAKKTLGCLFLDNGVVRTCTSNATEFVS
jgi:hypothetical protein